MIEHEYLLYRYRPRRATKGGGGGETSPLSFFKNQKKCPDFGKKGPNCVYTWVESFIQNVVLRVSSGKSSNIFPMKPFSFVFDNTTLTPQNLPCPKKYLVARLRPCY